MKWRPLLLITILTHGLAARAGADPQRFDPAAVKEVRDLAAKITAGKASDFQKNDGEYGAAVQDTLASLLRIDPAEAVRFFKKVRQQVAQTRSGAICSEGTASPKYRSRSISVLGAALGEALQVVDNASANGDENLPALIAAVAEMLSSKDGVEVESSHAVVHHAGNLLVKAATPAGGEGKFSVQTLIEKLGPQVKPEWVPALFGAARGITWGMRVKDDATAQKWLEERAKAGPHAELAMMLVAGARISSQENDSGNVPRKGILERDKLPEEQQWLIRMLEKPELPPVLGATFASEILRVWPTAEPPLRYAGAKALAAAWAAGVPVNGDDARVITMSLLGLSVKDTVPADDGMKAAAETLMNAALLRLRSAGAQYGLPAADYTSTAVPQLLRLAADARRTDWSEKLLSQLRAEVAGDPSLSWIVRASEKLQEMRLHREARELIDSITDAQLQAEVVVFDLRKHVASKRVHLRIEEANAAGGLDAAVKATVEVLNNKLNEPASWFGAAWAWHNMGAEFRAAGNAEEALRRYSMGCILGHAAEHFAGETFGHHAPPSEGACRDQLRLLKFNPDRVKVFTSGERVAAMLAEFGDGWNSLSKGARRRILQGAEQD